jgi:putative N6-adenine-specific DNA methylase
MAEFEAKNTDELYEEAVQLPWDEFLRPDQTFAINFAINSEYFTHTKYASLKLKDAICDQIREKHDARPSINTSLPDYQFLMHISDEFVSIYLDASGDTLNKRGYRQESVIAPINETLAAAMVKLSGWDPTTPLLDGMCGSGTIPLEAAFIARKNPSQWYRTQYGFKGWKNFNQDLWNEVKMESKQNVNSNKTYIYASDMSDQAIAATQNNIANAKMEDFITVQFGEFEKRSKPHPKGTLILNPPYGERLAPKDIFFLYKRMGNTFKNHFDNWDAWVITSNSDALKNVGLRTQKRIKLYNGALEVRFVHYPLYLGSKKKR